MSTRDSGLAVKRSLREEELLLRKREGRKGEERCTDELEKKEGVAGRASRIKQCAMKEAY